MMIALSRSRARQLGEKFLVGILEASLKTNPDEVGWLMLLGEVYTRRGEFGKGLAVDLKLSRLAPGNPMVWYNLACSYALTAQSDPAFAALEEAIRLGYRDAAHMEKDQDLAPLRSDPRYEKIKKMMIN